MNKEKTEREDMLRKTKIGQFDRYLNSYRVSQGYRLSQLIIFESLLKRLVFLMQLGQHPKLYQAQNQITITKLG